MKIVENGQGFLRDNLSGELAYQSFVPAPLQHVCSLELDDETIQLLGACSRKLGELEGMLQFVPDKNMYLAMYVRKEALLSAQIEGTQCTFDDILNPENTNILQRDVADVVAYVKATEYAVKCLAEFPLCMRLLCEVHAILLEGTRGENKYRGQIRSSQNWIGRSGCNLNEASFVPPNVNDLETTLSDLENFINNNHEIEPLIKTALVHYQFETAHPFLDGNGRLGRLLIMLSLLNDNVLTKAIFYPSYQFKLKRDLYYQALTDVREQGTYSQWVKFFSSCILESAEDAVYSLCELIELKNQNIEKIKNVMGKSVHNGLRFLDLLEANPIVEINFVAEKLEVSRTTASKLVDKFIALEILQQAEASKDRYRRFLYEDY
ncbi:MAG: Fic family protein, partial [Enterococcus sp.]|nr:Fic family protein [Enterococcus sp.]